MRKKLLLGLLALVLTSGVVVFGNSPGFLERIAHSVSGGVASLLSSDEKRAWEIVAKAGRTKRSARKGQVVPHEVPESMLWHVAFDFTRKIEAKAAESVSESNDGLLFRNYFVRQGPLSATNDKLLKGMAAEVFRGGRPH